MIQWYNLTLIKLIFAIKPGRIIIRSYKGVYKNMVTMSSENFQYWLVGQFVMVCLMISVGHATVCRSKTFSRRPYNFTEECGSQTPLVTFLTFTEGVQNPSSSCLHELSYIIGKMNSACLEKRSDCDVELSHAFDICKIHQNYKLKANFVCLNGKNAYSESNSTWTIPMDAESSGCEDKSLQSYFLTNTGYPGPVSTGTSWVTVNAPGRTMSVTVLNCRITVNHKGVKVCDSRGIYQENFTFDDQATFNYINNGGAYQGFIFQLEALSTKTETSTTKQHMDTSTSETSQKESPPRPDTTQTVPTTTTTRSTSRSDMTQTVTTTTATRSTSRPDTTQTVPTTTTTKGSSAKGTSSKANIASSVSTSGIVTSTRFPDDSTVTTIKPSSTTFGTKGSKGTSEGNVLSTDAGVTPTTATSPTAPTTSTTPTTSTNTVTVSTMEDESALSTGKQTSDDSTQTQPNTKLPQSQASKLKFVPAFAGGVGGGAALLIIMLIIGSVCTIRKRRSQQYKKSSKYNHAPRRSMSEILGDEEAGRVSAYGETQLSSFASNNIQECDVTKPDEIEVDKDHSEKNTNIKYDDDDASNIDPYGTSAGYFASDNPTDESELNIDPYSTSVGFVNPSFREENDLNIDPYSVSSSTTNQNTQEVVENEINEINAGDTSMLYAEVNKPKNVDDNQENGQMNEGQTKVTEDVYATVDKKLKVTYNKLAEAVVAINKGMKENNEEPSQDDTEEDTNN